MRSLPSYGSWALVTGASSGIGTAFTRALAASGVNVVLTARREDRLRALASELAPRVETRVIALDLGLEGAPLRLADAVADLEVGILVNNAGFGMAGRFEQASYERLLEMVRLNCTTVTALSRLLLPAMRARGRGAMIVLASAAGYQPIAYGAAYGATKAFDLMLAEALWAENRGSGVDVLAVSPGPVDTEFQAVAGESPHAGAKPEEVVRVAFAALGRKPSVVVGSANKLRAWSVRLGPRALVARIAATVMRANVPAEALR
ncbi:MAG: SDR family oxidoreductase [Deltaproteobacteria bacterium]|nr:SDR family oxidoreductase [Deltaproteobacteria bacterium]